MEVNTQKKVAQIMFNRRNAVYLDSNIKTQEVPQSDEVVVGAVATINALTKGSLVIAASDMEKLRYLTDDSLKAVIAQTVECWEESVGKRENINESVMYKNFPKSVFDMDEYKLYFNAFIGYCADILDPSFRDKYQFDGEKKERGKTIRLADATVLRFAHRQDFVDLNTNLLGGSKQLSTEDQETLELAYDIVGKEIFPAAYRLQENIIYAVTLCHKHGEDVTGIIKNAKNAKLLARAWSNIRGYTSKYNLSSSERITILSIIDRDRNAVENLWRNAHDSVLLGECLHPGKYQKRFPNAYKAFSSVRNDKHPSTFSSKVEKLIEENKYIDCASLLATRPGELARRLDYLVRHSEKSDAEKIIAMFKDVADKLPGKLLLDIYSHFTYRSDETAETKRVAFPNACVSRAALYVSTVEGIPTDLSQEIADICKDNFIQKLKDTKEPMGKVYIDTAMQNYLVPFTSKTENMGCYIARGSRTPISEDATCLRGFCYWRDLENGDRVDLDLQITFLDENLQTVESIGYFNLRDTAYEFACHSGDITAAPNGASEFVDIDLKKLKAYNSEHDNKYSYVAFVVNSFTHQPFATIPDSFFGIMERESMMSGEIYDEKTVLNKIDLNGTNTNSLPIIIDINNNEIIYTDLDCGSNFTAIRYGSREGKINAMDAALYAVLHMKKANLDTLIKFNIEARNGEMVLDREEADIVFALDGTVRPGDADIFMTEYIPE